MTQKFCDLLNWMLKQDPTLASDWAGLALRGNGATANHPHIQVDDLSTQERPCYVVTSLGILNGMLGEAQQPLVVRVEEFGEVIEYRPATSDEMEAWGYTFRPRTTG